MIDKAFFSSVLKEALEIIGLPVATQDNIEDIFEDEEARVFLSFLRLLANSRDQLAWLSILKIRKNKIGDITISQIYEFAASRGITFIDALDLIVASPGTITANESALAKEYKYINDFINKYNKVATTCIDDLVALITNVADNLIFNKDLHSRVISYLTNIINITETDNLLDLVIAMSTSLDDKEQEIDKGSINIMTMHKAKGLTAEAVFIVAAEDEYLPGQQIGDEEGDARRLLYVSLTRAKKYLYITYCKERRGRQRFTGSRLNTTRRSLSRFLIDAPLKPANGVVFTKNLTVGI
jgi:superfamily I DNA/RNA helicase